MASNNIYLMIYLIIVSLIGTLGNGVILLAYGNRWNSSKSTSIVFILILACVDLWTCLIVVPTIAIMEYRDFQVPTLICRFYSFSKILIMISSLIMSFIAVDRFFNIAMPHHRLLNPRRVKFLVTLFISIGIGLGVSTALAFSSKPYQDVYTANYSLILAQTDGIPRNNSREIFIRHLPKNSTPSVNLIHSIHSQLSIPSGVNISNIRWTYKSTRNRCFADTSIVPETVREVLRHISNKVFFISIGIVTILYMATFLLALHRQNPRIKALKKSLNVLNKFDSYSSSQKTSRSFVQQHVDSSRISTLNESKKILLEHSMKSNLTDDLDVETRKIQENQQESRLSSSNEISEEFNENGDKFQANNKRVSFQIENENVRHDNETEHLNSSDKHRNDQQKTFLRFNCLGSNSKQVLIQFEFPMPKLELNEIFHGCCCVKSRSLSERHSSVSFSNEEETTIISLSPNPNSLSIPSPSLVNSEILRKQLHRHRLKQIRMASTFLLITVSFVLFYLPSILYAERFIKSSWIIYYLYLCTHALNPLIYCFMNVNIRAHVLSVLKCRRKSRTRHATVPVSPSLLDR